MVKRKFIIHLFCFLFSFLLPTYSLWAQEFVVKLKTSIVDLDLGSSFSTNEIQILDTHEKGKLVLVKLKDESSSTQTNAIEVLKQDPRVDYVVENIKFHAFLDVDDPKYQEQWALKKVKAAEAWRVQSGSKETIVAVIDTGIALEHVDLKDNIWTNPNEIPNNAKDDDQNGFVDDIHGWDFRDKDNNPNDEVSDKNPGHGTHCAGIIGAVSNNGLGIASIAHNVSLMGIRFLGADGSGDLMSAAKAIDYAVDNGAHIISASWGAAVPRSGVKPILEAIQRAEKKGIIFVAAAANDGKSNDIREVYPANAGLSNVISVAASNSDDGKPSWSNFGKSTVDMSSPGAGILSTIPGNSYRLLSGTSMATPLVAGAASLLLSQARDANKEISPQEVKALFQSTGAKVKIETACECRLDMASALDALSQETLTPVPYTSSFELNAKKTLSVFGGLAPYSFKSSNEEVIKIDDKGEMIAQKEGEATITVTDSQGEEAISGLMRVGQKSSDNGQCPFGPWCEIICQFNPQLPWCQSA